MCIRFTKIGECSYTQNIIFNTYVYCMTIGGGGGGGRERGRLFMKETFYRCNYYIK